MTATLTGPFASHRVVAAPALPPLGDVARQPVAAVIHEEPPPQAPADTAGDPATPIEDLPWCGSPGATARGRWRSVISGTGCGGGAVGPEPGCPQADGRAGWWRTRSTSAGRSFPPTQSTSRAGDRNRPAGRRLRPGALVVPGDTLREIADAELGDPERYPEIFEASQAIEQPGGARLTDPDLILPGWTLRLPSPTPVPAEPAAPSGPTATPHPNGSPSLTTTTTGPPPTTDPSSTEPSVATTAPAPPTSEVDGPTPDHGRRWLGRRRSGRGRRGRTGHGVGAVSGGDVLGH
jgi:hypothetical protein